MVKLVDFWSVSERTATHHFLNKGGDYFTGNLLNIDRRFPKGCVCAPQDSWLYHLSVAVGTTVGRFGTEFEQLVGKLLQLDGDPGE